jgi:hypothetical protein
VSAWTCPACEHGLLPTYRRRWRDGLRKTYRRACLHCDYSEPYTPAARNDGLLYRWVRIGLVVLWFSAAIWGWGKTLGAW